MLEKFRPNAESVLGYDQRFIFGAKFRQNAKSVLGL